MEEDFQPVEHAEEGWALKEFDNGEKVGDPSKIANAYL